MTDMLNDNETKKAQKKTNTGKRKRLYDGAETSEVKPDDVNIEASVAEETTVEEKSLPKIDKASPEDKIESLCSIVTNAVEPSGPSKQKIKNAASVVKNYSLYSAATALIPMPWIDTVANLGIQIKMTKIICEIFEMEFSEQKAKAVIAALIGSFHTGLIAGSLIKLIPVLGVAGFIAPSAAASAGITYAIGQVFIRHFESGGALLDFDPEKHKAHFAMYYEKGRKSSGPQTS